MCAKYSMIFDILLLIKSGFKDIHLNHQLKKEQSELKLIRKKSLRYDNHF